MPVSNPPARIAVFNHALQLLEEVARASPGNVVNRIEISAIHNFVGDAYMAAKQPADAARAYSAGLAVAQPLLASGSGTVVTVALFMCRKLGEVLAARGDRAQSLAMAQRALDLSGPSGPAAGKRPAELQRILTPRGFAAMGLVRAALVTGPAGRPDDRIEARSWLDKSLAAYRELEKHPAFSEIHRREMRVVEQSLEKLK
jgi:tetratricopeptide (TPR) repeat protein